MDSEAEQWLAHPVVGGRVRDALRGTPWMEMLFDPRNGQMMRAIPLQRLTRFPGFPLPEEDLAQLVTDANA